VVGRAVSAAFQTLLVLLAGCFTLLSSTLLASIHNGPPHDGVCPFWVMRRRGLDFLGPRRETA
jgi:hypothetical protein